MQGGEEVRQRRGRAVTGGQRSEWSTFGSTGRLKAAKVME